MNAKKFIACLIISTLFSCSGNSDNHSENEQQNDDIPEERSTFKDWTDESGTWLDLPLDSAQLIAEMNLIEHVDRTDLIATDSDSLLLNSKVDTFIMHNIGAACTCPNWEIIGCEDSLPSHVFGGPCKFYNEPAHPDLEIQIPYSYFELKIRFIGKKYLKPVGDGEKGEASIGGNVFKYYSFEFIRPYHVYGPNYNDTVFWDTDTVLQTFTSQLTVD